MNSRDVSWRYHRYFMDVLNKVTIDSTLEPAHSSERECAEQHFQYINSQDLILGWSCKGLIVYFPKYVKMI